MFPWMAAGAAGSSLLGGLAANRARGGQAQKDRDFQSAEAATSRQFTSSQATRQMAFQERMRNTSWQAGIEDMKAAGVNPALAYSQGGASAPMGTSGSGAAGSGSRANMEDALSPAVSSGMQAKRMTQELKNMVAVADLTLAQKYKADQEGRESRAREMSIDAARPGIKWNNELTRLGIAGARNIEAFEGGKMGQKTRTVRSLLQSVFGSGGAFRAR